MQVTFIDEASADVAAAFAYYRRIRPGLERRFLEALDATTERIREQPLAGQLVERRRPVRRWLLQGFQYAVIYEIRDQLIRIMAVAHHRRRPRYWMRRR